MVLLAALVLVQTPQSISFTCMGSRAPVLLAKLSVAMGRPLSASKSTENEVMVVSVKKVDPGELLNRIAQVAHAQWEQQGDGLVLTRSMEQAAADRSADRDYRTKEIAAQILKVTEPLTKHPTFDVNQIKVLADVYKAYNNPNQTRKYDAKTAEKAREAEANSPANRLLAKLLMTFNVRTLSEIEPDSRAVYSTNPTAMQFGLHGIEDAMRAYVSEKQIWDAATTEMMDAVQTQAGDGDYPSSRNANTGPLSRIELVISRSGSKPTLAFSCTMLDRDGQQIDQAMGAVNSFDAEYFSGRKSPAKAGDKPVDWSADSKAVMDSLKWEEGSDDISLSSSLSSQAQPPSSHTSPRAKEIIRQPETIDPLSLAPSDLLVSWSKDKDKQLVALLPDDMMAMLFVPVMDNVAGVRAMMDMTSKLDLETKIDGDWALAYPPDAYLTRTSRFDRFAFGRAIRLMGEKGSLSLDDLAQYSSSAKGLDTDPLFFFAFAVERDVSSMANIGQWDMLRFYGTLTTTQRSTLGKGGKIELGVLSPNQQRLVQRMVFTSASPVGLESPNQDTGDAEMDAKQLTAMQAEAVLLRESTNALPRGLDNRGYVSLTQKTEEVAIPNSMVNYGYGRGLSADELGEAVGYQAYQANQGMDPAMNIDLKKLCAGRRNIYSFVFTLAPRIVVNQELVDMRLDRSKVLSLESMSKDFQAKFAAKKAEIAESMKDMKNDVGQDTGTRGTPPPY